MHILVIEDDPRLSQYLSKALTGEGYTVDVCASVDETKSYMSTESEYPRLIILDRMLGRDDGTELIPKLKTKYPDTGILILSSLDMPSEKAKILDAGADEYLAKPFSLEELTARLRLVARRGSSHNKGADHLVRSLGNLTLDLKTQTVMVGNLRLDLTKKELQLISLLIDHPGRVFNRFQILDRVWEIERITESNVVETTIKNLRKKLSEAASSARIESKRNIGYWIET